MDPLSPVLIDPATIQAAPFRCTTPSDKPRMALRLSVERHGILQPLHVRRVEDATDKYQIIDGHCRWEAAAKLGIQVPCYVHDATLDEAQVLAMELNFIGSELCHVDIAKLFSANAKFLGYDRAMLLNSWPRLTFESYVAMADYDWEKSLRRSLDDEPTTSIFGSSFDELDNGEEEWRDVGGSKKP